MMNTPKEASMLSVSTEKISATGDGNDEEDEGFQGNVTPRNAASITPREQSQFPSGGSSTHSNSTSSWASKDELRRQKKQERGKRWSSIKKNRRQKETTGTGTNFRNTPPRPGLKRSKTPTTNNLSAGFFSEGDDSIAHEELTTSLLPPTVILDGEAGDGRGAVYSRETRNQGTPQRKPQQYQQQQQEEEPPPSSFRKWLAEGMLDTLNVVAGITLSTTGTILTPPMIMTKNILLPSLLGILVNTLDAVTPASVQDWFRILSSSVYHFFDVLFSGSTEKGRRFRSQVTQVAQSSLEVWSAPESRQVVVDGMATGVKLADALHTPEMKIFLDQLGVLGCRLGDAMASGKSKELLLNFKDLIWTSIELASDPSTTLALAEVTAHLCHALKEVDDSFDQATPRAVRNAHNEKTYLDSSLMTKDYPFESMEKIILSSLGMDVNHNENGDINYNESIDDTGYGMEDDSTEQSIPSNVAFRVDGVAGSTPLDIPNLEEPSNWEKTKERVDLDLLQRKILYEGRPQARPPKDSGDGNSTKVYSRNTNDRSAHDENLRKESSSLHDNMYKPQNNDQRGSRDDIGEDYARIEDDMEELPLPRESRNPPMNIEHRNPANTKELYDKFERMETMEPEKPSYVQFFNALDELLNTKRMEKENNIRDCLVGVESEGDNDGGNKQAIGQDRKARVRILRKGITREEKQGSKMVRERYSNLRRLWKYPRSLVNFSAFLVLLVLVFWIGFGIYGMYTLFHQVVYFDSGIVVPPINHALLHPVQQQQKQQQMPPPIQGFDPGSTNHDNERSGEKMKNDFSHEIVIRIVKEVVHVREDGSKIENYGKVDEGNLFAGKISQENIDGEIDAKENIVVTSDATEGAQEEEDDNTKVAYESIDKFINMNVENMLGSGMSQEAIEEVKKYVASTLEEEVRDD